MITRLIAGAVIVFILILAASSSTYVVEPGHRGVQVTLGKVSPVFKPEGFGLKMPFVTTVIAQPIRQQTATVDETCYSSDLQQITIGLKVLYRIPEASVVALFRDYQGQPFDTLIKPRVAEALKEIVALRNAESIVQKREEVKSRTLEIARKKLGGLLMLEDVVVEHIKLTQVLENAIEAKMVQQQEAARAKFAQQQAETEAKTVVIKATGEAESINLRGQALRENPSVLELQVVEQWDGVTPIVVGPGATGANMLLPLGDLRASPAPASKP
ncbi:MAG: prohibitin family protein [Verrucomicrobia bacterium]|nr:prohibitin family protein [Verrucomicrobiota bacterium]